MGVWNEEEQRWSEDDIEGLEYKVEERTLEFNLKRFAPIAYLQSKTLDYPYDSWYIRTIGDQVGLLTMRTARMIEVRIKIYPLYVELVEMK